MLHQRRLPPTVFSLRLPTFVFRLFGFPLLPFLCVASLQGPTPSPYSQLRSFVFRLPDFRLAAAGAAAADRLIRAKRGGGERVDAGDANQLGDRNSFV